MKKFCLFLSLLLFFSFISCNGDEKIRIEGVAKLIAVEKNHATRIYVIYLDKNGLFYRRSLHQSGCMTDGICFIDPHDYLSTYGGQLNYGPLPGCEKEYQVYLSHQ